jgi:uncharacterized protein YjiS (DUF1127 family)
MTHFRRSEDMVQSCCTSWDTAPPRPGGLARVMEALGARWRTARDRRAETLQLAAMSDGELADMSISRPDTHRLFDPRFAHEYEQRRSGRRMSGR